MKMKTWIIFVLLLITFKSQSQNYIGKHLDYVFYLQEQDNLYNKYEFSQGKKYSTLTYVGDEQTLYYIFDRNKICVQYVVYHSSISYELMKAVLDELYKKYTINTWWGTDEENKNYFTVHIQWINDGYNKGWAVVFDLMN